MPFYLNWNWNFLSFRFDSVKKKLFSVLINWACVPCDVQLLKRIKWGDCLFYFYFSTSFNMGIAFDADADSDSSLGSFCHIDLVLVCYVRMCVCVCVFSFAFHHNNYYWILFLKCFHGEASSNHWLLLLFLSVKLMWFMTALSCVPLKFLSCTLALPFVCFMLSQKVKKKNQKIITIRYRTKHKLNMFSSSLHILPSAWINEPQMRNIFNMNTIYAELKPNALSMCVEFSFI